MFSWKMVKGNKNKSNKSKSKDVNKNISDPELLSVVAEPAVDENEVVTVVDINEHGQRVLTREIKLDTNLLKTSHIRLENVYEGHEEVEAPEIPVADVTGEQTVIAVDWKVDQAPVEEPAELQIPLEPLQESVLSASNFLDPNNVVDNFEKFSANEAVAPEAQENWFNTAIATASHDLFADDNSPFELYRSNIPIEPAVEEITPSLIQEAHDEQESLEAHDDSQSDVLLPELSELQNTQIGVNELAAPELMNLKANQQPRTMEVKLETEYKFAKTVDIPVQVENKPVNRFFSPDHKLDDVTAPTFINVDYDPEEILLSKKRHVEVKEYGFVPHKHFDLSSPKCSTLEMEFDNVDLIEASDKQEKENARSAAKKPKASKAKVDEIQAIEQELVSENLQFLEVDINPFKSDFLTFEAPKLESLISPTKKTKSKSSKRKSTAKNKKKVKHEYKIKSLTEYKKNKFRGPELIFDASH